VPDLPPKSHVPTRRRSSADRRSSDSHQAIPKRTAATRPSSAGGGSCRQSTTTDAGLCPSRYSAALPTAPCPRRTLEQPQVGGKNARRHGPPPGPLRRVTGPNYLRRGQILWPARSHR
jgi:hypothetical protein